MAHYRTVTWDEKAARKLWDKGYSVTLIAERIGTTPKAVSARAFRKRWPLRHPKFSPRHRKDPCRRGVDMRRHREPVRVRCAQCWNTYACESGEAAYTTACPHCHQGAVAC